MGHFPEGRFHANGHSFETEVAGQTDRRGDALVNTSRLIIPQKPYFETCERPQWPPTKPNANLEENAGSIWAALRLN